MDSKQFINHLVDLVTSTLEELNSVPKNDFIHGEMTAYVDILEQIQKHQKVSREKLDYVISKKYKI